MAISGFDVGSVISALPPVFRRGYASTSPHSVSSLVRDATNLPTTGALFSISMVINPSHWHAALPKRMGPLSLAITKILVIMNC